MRFKHEQTFPFTIDTAWKALHKPSSLDISPGSDVTVISDTEWKTQTTGSNEKVLTTTHYTATFDDEEKRVTIEGISDTKRGHDFIYQNFEALCTGKETKRMSKEELDSHAKDIFS